MPKPLLSPAALLDSSSRALLSPVGAVEASECPAHTVAVPSGQLYCLSAQFSYFSL